MFRSVMKAAVVAASVLVAGSTSAAISVVNGSFETDALADGGFIWWNAPPSWGGFGDIQVNPFASQLQPQDGSQYVFMWSKGTLNGSGENLQSVLVQDYPAASLEPGTYTFTAGLATESANTKGKISIFLESVPPVGAQFGINTPTVATEVNLNSTTFTDFSTTTTLNPGDPLLSNTLRLVIRVDGNSGDMPADTFAVDNVRLAFTAVPEPASLSLLGLAGCGMLCRRRSH